MHYYWLKKKWFFDIITSNLLFAFLLTTNSADIDLDVDIDYAEVAPFEVEVAFDGQSFDINGFDIKLSVLNGFSMTVQDDKVEIDSHITFGDFVSAYEIDLDGIIVPNNVDITKMRFATNVHSYPFAMEHIQNEFYDISVTNNGMELVYTIPFDFQEDVEVPIPNIPSFYYDLAYIEEFKTFLLFKIPNVKNESSVVLTEETKTDLEFKKIDSSITFNSISTVSIKPTEQISVSKKDTTIGFYYCPVIRLNISSTQNVPKRNVSSKIELVNYVTRFSDLEGLIVQDFTGKKFKDLRNLAI